MTGFTINENAPDNEKRPIVVIGPMDCEIDDIEKELENPVVAKIGEYRFTSGTINGYPVVAARSLIGMVNSTATTVLAVTAYNPCVVIICGTSGGHTPGLHQGDIVLGENLVELGSYYTLDREAGEGSYYPEWTYPGEEMPVDGNIVRVQVLHSDEGLLKTAMGVKYIGGKLLRGTIASADIWNKEVDRILFYHEKFGTDCEEMEGFAVGQICRHFGVPMLAVRILSNSHLYPEELFDERFSNDCQAYVLDVIKAVIAGK